LGGVQVGNYLRKKLAPDHHKKICYGRHADLSNAASVTINGGREGAKNGTGEGELKEKANNAG